MSEYILEMNNIDKNFAGVKALKGVTLKVRPGTVHALMGENGAGKSTLMKCLLGINHLDGGEIIFKGEKLVVKSPIDALTHGIAMIHQELSPIPLRTVVENVWVGRQKKKGILLDNKRMIKEARELFKSLEIDIDPLEMMGNLSVAKMQMVEIAKAISYNSEIIIMDEATSALTEAETRHLFKVIRQLKEKGKTIIYISHKMDEIFEICDDVTVFRDGTLVGSDSLKNLTEQSLIKMMVGRELTNMYPKVDCQIGDVYLKVENLSAGKAFQNVSFELHRGEILGFAGLVGAGRTEIVETIFGIRRRTGGKIYIDDKEVSINSPIDGIANKIALLTEDRRNSGIVPVSSVLNNISIASIAKYVRYGMLNHRKIKEDALLYGKKLSIKTASYDTPIMNLSGGNQQKCLVARWLLTNPEILIVDEPTRGIDVGAKAEIHTIISSLAKEGKAIIVISSEMPEVMAVSDRILVMHEGEMTGIIDRKDFSQELIMAYCSGINTGKVGA